MRSFRIDTKEADMSKRLIGIAAAVVGTCCGATVASAQAPSMFFEQFNMGAPQQCGGHTFCTGAAHQALQDERLKIPNKNTLFGFNQNLSVLVVCHGVGDHSFVVVVAASTDGNAADNMAKNVHKRMSGAGCL
jgi:hypothetical protein